MVATVGTPRVVGSSDSATREALSARYRAVRSASEALCGPLAPDDYGLQATADTSPPKWHLAHTSWFFETFLLRCFLHGYETFQPQFDVLFNSYYQTIGKQYPRAQRGLLSRPTITEVYRYRAHVDAAMLTLLADVGPGDFADVAQRVTLGCHHEQQHQELLLTDIKYSLSVNPLRPAYRDDLPEIPDATPPPLQWIKYTGGVREVGHARAGFAFDNETPWHSVYMQPYALASRLVTCGEYSDFIDAGGYRRPEYWLADGWRAAQERDWQAPLYWERRDGSWWHFTLAGMRPVQEHAPVCHVSFYEADAYARFAEMRLPTEHEWEIAAGRPVAGNLREHGYLHPVPAGLPDAHEPSPLPLQMWGDVWEWTQSAYAPYPGYRAPEGALGEYNGKFMVNQMVLRGGSCVTPADHIRATYRNFFYPVDRWQFSGIRLADDR